LFDFLGLVGFVWLENLKRSEVSVVVRFGGFGDGFVWLGMDLCGCGDESKVFWLYIGGEVVGVVGVYGVWVVETRVEKI
jgi:hypothetical protein